MNSNESQFLAFPENFLWGVSTSPHQVEGGTHNDWTVWENSPERLSDLKAKGKLIQEYRSGKAANSWELYEQDFGLIQELHCGAYRLGVEWSRIEPEKGIYSLEAIAHYKKMLESLKSKNIKVTLTLWHWTVPVWFQQAGGWTNKASISDFKRFTELCVKEFGQFVDIWVVLNEPLMIVGHGYITGKFPPNHKKDIYNGVKIAINLVKAYKASYRVIHNNLFEPNVGLAMTCGYFDALNPKNPIERMMVKVADYFRNYWFLARIKNHYDYIGVNYYHHDRLTWRPPFKKNENKKMTDFGWEIFPEGIYHVLKGYARLKKPIYILENGIADAADKQRVEFIKDHLYYIHKAIKENCPVKGYFHWSLIDNFEWADGYWPQFGLYKVDRQTFERTARPSAAVYGNICKDNGFLAD